MSGLRSTENRRGNGRPEHPLWPYLATGFVVGAAVIAFALLPQQVYGLPLVAAAGLISLIDFLARRSSASPSFMRLRRGMLFIYAAVVGVVVLCGLVLVAVVVRNGDALWLAWTMAGLFFAMITGGWLVDKRSTVRTDTPT